VLCICRYRHLSSTCALWRVGGSHRAVRSAGREQSYRGARGASPPRLVTTLMPDGGRAFSTSGVGRSLSGRAVWVSIAVCSSQYPSSCREYADRRVRVRGCGAWPWGGAEVVGQPAGTRKRSTSVFHTLITHTEVRTGNFRQPRTVSLLSSVPSRLQSPKSSERAQSPISRRAPSTGARVPVCGRGWVVRCPCFNFKFTVLNRYRAVGGAEYFAPSVSCERGPRARCERKKRTRWPTPDS
jgi:hypothetical protein